MNWKTRLARKILLEAAKHADLSGARPIIETTRSGEKVDLSTIGSLVLKNDLLMVPNTTLIGVKPVGVTDPEKLIDFDAQFNLGLSLDSIRNRSRMLYSDLEKIPKAFLSELERILYGGGVAWSQEAHNTTCTQGRQIIMDILANGQTLRTWYLCLFKDGGSYAGPYEAATYASPGTGVSELTTTDITAGTRQAYNPSAATDETGAAQLTNNGAEQQYTIGAGAPTIQGVLSLMSALSTYADTADASAGNCMVSQTTSSRATVQDDIIKIRYTLTLDDV